MTNDEVKSEERNIDEYLKQTAIEIERLKGVINELSLMLGMLRGCLFEFEDRFDSNKAETVKRIDKSIERIFYTGYFKTNENNR